MDSPTTSGPVRPAAPGWRSPGRALGLVFRPSVGVALLILATLFARFGILATPVSWVRPTQSAMMTRNLERDLGEIGWKAFFYPRVDYCGDQSGVLVQELPLVNLAGALLQKVFGVSLEVAHRLPSLLLFAPMLAFTFAFLRARFGAAEGLVACLLLSTFPIVVFQSVDGMPEQAVLTVFAAGAYFFDRYLDEGAHEKRRKRALLASAACFALMLLIKFTSGLLLLVPVGLHLHRRGTLRGLLTRRTVATGLIAALPVVAWLVHAWRVNPTSSVDDGRSMALLIDNYLAQHDRWQQLVAGKTYVGLLDMLTAACGRWPLYACALGLVLGLSPLGRCRAVLACWLVSFALFFVVLPFNLSTHWYYPHSYTPLIALGASIAICTAARGALRLVPAAARAPAQALLGAAGLVLALQARWDHVPYFEAGKREFGLALQELLAPRALGIISSEEKGVWNGELFYVSDTRGWRVSTRGGLSWRPLSAEAVEDMHRRGAEFLAHFGDPEQLAARVPELFQRLEVAGAEIGRAPGWILFSLAKLEPPRELERGSPEEPPREE